MNRAQKSMEDRDRHVETIHLPLWANATSSKPLLLAGFFLWTHSSSAGLRYIYLAHLGMSGFPVLEEILHLSIMGDWIMF